MARGEGVEEEGRGQDLTLPAEFPLWRRALEMGGDDDGRRL